MRLVVDSNIILLGLINEPSVHEITYNRKFRFYTPYYVFFGIKKYRDYFRKEYKIENKDFDKLLDELLDRIRLVHHEEFKDSYSKALKLMRDINPGLSAFLAVGLSLKLDGIWAVDRDFYSQDLIKVYSTNDLLPTKKAIEKELKPPPSGLYYYGFWTCRSGPVRIFTPEPDLRDTPRPISSM